MLIDTHCHLNFKAYKDDAAEVIQRAFDNDVWMINVGSQKDTSRLAVELADQYKQGLYATIGLHPTHTVAHGFNDDQELGFTPRQEKFDSLFYQSLVDSSSKIVAIGECGLDYYRLPENRGEEIKKMQYEAFMTQAEFSAVNKLPLIVHCRDAHCDQIAAIKQAYLKWPNERKGVVHCFTGSYEEAMQYIEMGWYISFTGIAVFASEVAKVAQKLPLESIMIETDAPYLSPPPFRGKRNEPSFVKYIAEDMAKRRGISFEEVAEITTANAKKLFDIK